MISGSGNLRELCQPLLSMCLNGWNHFQIGNLQQKAEDIRTDVLCSSGSTGATFLTCKQTLKISQLAC